MRALVIAFLIAPATGFVSSLPSPRFLLNCGRPASVSPAVMGRLSETSPVRRHGGLRALVAQDNGDSIPPPPPVLRPERVALALKTAADMPRVPLCLRDDAQDREVRARLGQILRQRTALELILQQVADSVSDIQKHVGRDLNAALARAEEQAGGTGFRTLSARLGSMSSTAPAGASLPRFPNLSPAPPRRKPRVVVLGSGWGAHAFVKVVDTDKFDVVAISPRPYFIFTPMLASSAVGTVEYRSISEPMRASNPLVEYYEAEATAINAGDKQIECVSAKSDSPRPFVVGFDFLVVAVGMESATFGVPGVREHCFFLKEVDDARKLRAALVARFEAASLPTLSPQDRAALLTFVVVGGGPTGVEFSGELFDFVQQDVKRYYPALAPLVQTKLLQSGKGLLETFDAEMQAQALANLERAGVDVILNARVTAVTDSHISFARARPGEASAGTDTMATEAMPYGVCVWACGNAPRALCERLIADHQGGGGAGPVSANRRLHPRILVDPWLRMVGCDDGAVFAIGDCAAAEDAPLPQTAQVAAQQGAFVAHLLNDQVRGNEGGAGGQSGEGYGVLVEAALGAGRAADDPVAVALAQAPVTYARPFEFLSLGVLAYIGNSRALAQVEVAAQDKRLVAFNQAGIAGWLLWRSVYLTKQVAFRNRVLVLFDWLKPRVFRRDIECLC